MSRRYPCFLLHLRFHSYLGACAQSISGMQLLLRRPCGGHLLIAPILLLAIYLLGRYLVHLLGLLLCFGNLVNLLQHLVVVLV